MVSCLILGGGGCLLRGMSFITLFGCNGSFYALFLEFRLFLRVAKREDPNQFQFRVDSGKDTNVDYEWRHYNDDVITVWLTVATVIGMVHQALDMDPIR